MDTIETLNANYDSLKGSFLYFLHEEAVFHEKSFWDYYNCIENLGKQAVVKGIDNEISCDILPHLR